MKRKVKTMAYEPTVWTSGDLVTATKLNKMEQGIVEAANSSSGGMVITVTNGTFDKTWNEVNTSIQAGVMPFIKYVGNMPTFAYITGCYLYNSNYTVRAWGGGGNNLFYTCSSTDGYPTDA